MDGWIHVRDIFYQPEYEHSKYAFETSNQEMLFNLYNTYEAEAKSQMEFGLVHPAYDYILKCSHVFNLLDAKGAISVTERTAYIGRMRNMARQVAKAFYEEREKLGFPILKQIAKEAGNHE